MDKRKRPFTVCPACRKHVFYVGTRPEGQPTCSTSCAIVAAENEQRAIERCNEWRTMMEGERARKQIIQDMIDEAEHKGARVKRAMRRIKKNYSEFGDYAECAALLACLQQRTKELQDEFVGS